MPGCPARTDQRLNRGNNTKGMKVNVALMERASSPHKNMRVLIAASVGNVLEWYDFVVYAIFAVHLFAIGRYARLTQHLFLTKKTTTPVNPQTTLIKFQIKLGSQCQWLTFLGEVVVSCPRYIILAREAGPMAACA